MKVLWICRLPRDVRVLGRGVNSAQSWITGHLPPPADVELHVLCSVFGLDAERVDFEAMGAHWHCFRLRRFEPLFLRRRFAWQVRAFVRMLKPDVIHGWGGETGNGLVATYLSRCSVVSVQGLLKMLSEGRGHSFAGRVRLLLECMTYRRAAVCLCESEIAKRELKRLYGVGGEIVFQPLRQEFLDGCESPLSDFRKEDRHRSFLFVGQDVPRKGIDDLREVGRRYPELPITYVTGGKSVEEVISLMQTHSALVLPSYGETGPTVVKEALAMGLWPICYDNSGAHELITRYGAGTLVPTGDVRALERALLDFSPGEHAVALSAAQSRIRNDLSARAVWPQLLAVYRKVVSVA